MMTDQDLSRRWVKRINEKFTPVARLSVKEVELGGFMLSVWKGCEERQIHVSSSWDGMRRYLQGYYYGIVDTLNLIKEM